MKNKEKNLRNPILGPCKAHTNIVSACSVVFAMMLSSQALAQNTISEKAGDENTILAHNADINMKEIVVKGNNIPLVRISEDAAVSPAGTTILGRKQLDKITFNTYGDIYRNQVGMHVVEYNQGLVAYGVSVRGFDEGHGRNLAAYLDGMPLNVSSSQHTNGYADHAQIIPELLERVEITRGPFSIMAGNHAVGGSVQYQTAYAVPSSFKYQIDTFGRSRVLPIVSLDIGPGRLITALDAMIGDGYTKASEAKRVNFFTRYSMPLGEGEASLRIQAYAADADSPGYRDKAKLSTGEHTKRSRLTHGIGDAKTQQNIVLNYRSNDLEGATGWGSGWFASGYYNRDVRRRWANFDLSLPINSREPLRQERDLLHQVGFDIRKTTSFDFLIPAQVVTGFQLNSEELHGARHAVDSRRNRIIPDGVLFTDTTSVKRRVYTNTQAFYGNLQIQPISRVKLMAGFRYDWMHFRTKLNPEDDIFQSTVDAGLPTEIRQSDEQFSPKLGAVLSAYQSKDHTVELYGNIARGLKSPYAFSDFYANVAGVTSPSIANLSITSLWSYEYGLKASASDGRYDFRIGFWNTDQDNESSRNAAGFVQSFQKTSRDGFDVEGSWKILPSTRIFANYSQVRARIKNPVDAGSVYIPLVPKQLVTFGVESRFKVAGNPLSLMLANNYVGRMAISTDNSLRTKTYHRYTLRAAYELPKTFYNAVISANVIGYTRQLEEVAFDFGGGSVGVSPSPRVKATFTIAVPLSFSL